MSGRSDESVAAEAARRRRELRAEQQRHEVTRAALEDANRKLIALYLRGRLADVRYFEDYIGYEHIVDERGSVLWARLDRALEILLADRPTLAAPEDVMPGRKGMSAVEWMSAGS